MPAENLKDILWVTAVNSLIIARGTRSIKYRSILQMNKTVRTSQPRQFGEKSPSPYQMQQNRILRVRKRVKTRREPAQVVKNSHRGVS